MLVIHIIAGHLALLSGFMAIVGRKGSAPHRLSGKVFFYSMLGVSFSGIWLSLKADNLFLLLISTFVLYQNLNGFLAVRDKSLRLRCYSPLILLMGLGTALWMISTLNPVLLSFGGIQAFLLIQDTGVAIKVLRGKQISHTRAMTRHIGQMTGAYIGAFTAFLVVNIDFLPSRWSPVVWLGPTLVFSPFLIYWLRRIRRSRALQTSCILLTVSIGGGLRAQPYAEKQSRHRFAQTYLGLFGDWQNPAATQRAGLQIGGLHFWGHADFRVEIPLWRSNDNGLQPQIATQFKYYPWAIRENKIRPYLGLAWQPTHYRESGGPELLQHRFPVLAGLTFNLRSWLLGLNLNWQKNRLWDYPLAGEGTVRRKPESLSLGLSFNYYFDTSLSAEENWESGRSAWLADTLGRMGLLNSWTIGLGLSSAFYLRQYPAPASVPHLKDPGRSGLLPDLSLGYYWHKPDLQLQGSYRYFNREQEAYGDALRHRRHSLALETYAFFGDYHGFVPFVGGGASVNWLKRSFEGALTSCENLTALLPQLTLGWDIRPNRLQKFYLRTHLRYTFSTSELTSRNWSVANFEMNFIQLVLLLDRF